jgi:superfamily I DNA/RNA helicase
MAVKLTPEQYEIREHLTHEDGIVLVSAGPGTGKTFIAEQLIQALSPTTVLYTAFNKAIVAEAKERFGSSEVECKTLHAVAYKYTNPNKDIRPTNYRDLPKKLSYNLKYLVLQGLENFFVSSSADMWEFFEFYFEEEEEKELLVTSATDLVDEMLSKTVPWSFSFMLKYFHLMLLETPDICSYGLVILDEINDTTAVALEIFKLLKSPKKLGLGEPHQAIYSFMNLVNGFEELEDVPIYPLTYSFRCSTDIASKIERFMQKDVEKTVSFKGTDKPVKNGKFLYCTMTNASIISELVTRLSNNKGFILLRKPVDIFACSLAVLSASNGKQVYQTQYKYLHDVHENWVNDPHKKHATFFKYLLEELKDQEVHSAVRLLLGLVQKGVNLFDLYSKVKAHKQGGDYTIATVYTSKGLEFETVTLADEFDSLIRNIRLNGGIQTKEELVTYRCYYVAASRAGVNLLNANALR